MFAAQQVSPQIQNFGRTQDRTIRLDVALPVKERFFFRHNPLQTRAKVRYTRLVIPTPRTANRRTASHRTASHRRASHRSSHATRSDEATGS